MRSRCLCGHDDLLSYRTRSSPSPKGQLTSLHRFGKQKDADPNPNFTFIRSLGNDEEALALLRALAAQVKPICKAHGFGVNSFEEYEWNSVFAGRNWNAGEVIEIVLRRPNGSFCPTGWLVHVVRLFASFLLGADVYRRTGLP